LLVDSGFHMLVDVVSVSRLRQGYGEARRSALRARRRQPDFRVRL